MNYYSINKHSIPLNRRNAWELTVTLVFGLFACSQVLGFFLVRDNFVSIVASRFLLIVLCLLFIFVLSKKVTLAKSKEYQKVFMISCLCFLIHISFAMVFYQYYWLPEHINVYSAMTGFDSLRYEFYGNQLAESWSRGDMGLSPLILLNPANYGYYIFCAIIYFIFGFDIILTIFLSSFFVIVASLGAYKLVKIYGASKSRSVLALLLVGLNFQTFLYGSLTAKDTFVYALITWLLVKFIEFIRGGNLSHLKSFMILLTAILSVRVGVAFAFMGYMVIVLFLSVFRNFHISFSNKIKLALILFVIAGVSIAVLSSLGNSLDYVINRDYFVAHGAEHSVSELHQMGRALDTNGFAYRLVGNLDIYHLHLLPLSWFLQFLDPFPFWKLDTFNHVFGAPQVLLDLLIMPIAIFSIISCLKNKLGREGRLLVLFFFVLLSAVSFSMIGVNNRYLMSDLPFYYVLVSIAPISYKVMVNKYIPIGLTLVLALSVAYASVKGV